MRCQGGRLAWKRIWRKVQKKTLPFLTENTRGRLAWDEFDISSALCICVRSPVHGCSSVLTDWQKYKHLEKQPSAVYNGIVVNLCSHARQTGKQKDRAFERLYHDADLCTGERNEQDDRACLNIPERQRRGVFVHLWRQREHNRNHAGIDLDHLWIRRGKPPDEGEQSSHQSDGHLRVRRLGQYSGQEDLCVYDNRWLNRSDIYAGSLRLYQYRMGRPAHKLRQHGDHLWRHGQSDFLQRIYLRLEREAACKCRQQHRLPDIWIQRGRLTAEEDGQQCWHRLLLQRVGADRHAARNG